MRILVTLFLLLAVSASANNLIIIQNNTTGNAAAGGTVTCTNGTESIARYSLETEFGSGVINQNIAPGGSYSVNKAGLTAGNFNWYVYTTGNAEKMLIKTVWMDVTNGSADNTFVVPTVCGQTFTQCTTLTIANSDSVYHQYQVVKDCVPVCGAYLTVPPGGRKSLTLCNTNQSGYLVKRINPAANYSLQIVSGCGLAYVPDSGTWCDSANGTTVTTTFTWAVEGAQSSTSTDPSTPTPSTYTSGTNAAPISFTNNNSDAILKTGFSALYDATVKIGLQTGQKLDEVKAAVEAGTVVNANGFASVTGAVWGSAHFLSNALSGLGSGTNGGGSDSNWLSEINHSLTNVGPTNIMDTSDLGEAAGAATRATLDGVLDGVPSDVGTPGGIGGSWEISAGAFTINLDPFSYPWVVALAAFCRALINWACVATMMLFAMKVTQETIAAGGNARQATAASATPVASSAVALGMAGFITIALAVVPVALVAYMSGGGGLGGTSWTLAQFFSPPDMGGGGGSLGSSLAMVDQFIPLATVVALPINMFAFRATAAGHLWTAQTVVRFLVG